MTGKTKTDIFQIIAAHEERIRAFGVNRLGLFGSFVRDQAVPGSDVDLLVEFEPGLKSFLNFVNLGFFLEEILDRKVELVTYESLSPYNRSGYFK